MERVVSAADRGCFDRVLPSAAAAVPDHPGGRDPLVTVDRCRPPAYPADGDVRASVRGTRCPRLLLALAA